MHTEVENTRLTLPSTLTRRRATTTAAQSGATPTPKPRHAQPHGHAPTRARVDALVRKNWRRLLVLAIVAVALTISGIAAWPVVFHSDAATAPTDVAQEARATNLLRTVSGAGRTLFAAHHTYAKLSRTALSAGSYNVRVVASTVRARLGEVSMRVTNSAVLTLATPADAQRCVFARDEPAKSAAQFATIRTADCRADAAPARGWSTR